MEMEVNIAACFRQLAPSHAKHSKERGGASATSERRHLRAATEESPTMREGWRPLRRMRTGRKKARVFRSCGRARVRRLLYMITSIGRASMAGRLHKQPRHRVSPAVGPSCQAYAERIREERARASMIYLRYVGHRLFAYRVMALRARPLHAEHAGCGNRKCCSAKDPHWDGRWWTRSKALDMRT